MNVKRFPWYLWPIGFLLDDKGNLSTSKIMAYGILVAKFLKVPIGALDETLLITASFGYSMWKDYKDVWHWQNGMTETLGFTRTETINRNENKQITENRNVNEGFDPSEPKPDPHHVEP